MRKNPCSVPTEKYQSFPVLRPPLDPFCPSLPPPPAGVVSYFILQKRRDPPFHPFPHLIGRVADVILLPSTALVSLLQ